MLASVTMTEPPVRFPLGISDFRMVRERGLAYVDKTGLIDAVLRDGAQVMLAPRPRRFGKTLNLSMLRYFFERSTDDRSALFAGLTVAASQLARPHFQRYPVIFLTFKDLKPTSWEDCLAGVASVMAEAYAEHAYLLGEPELAPADAALFSAIAERRASKTDLVIALRVLSRLLSRHHREAVVILIDEYDTPIHAGFSRGYYEEAIAFFRDLLSGGLKDNTDLFKGVLTGVLRVAKESLFSGLNNVVVYGILRPELGAYFGFTEPEVRALVEEVGAPALLDDLRTYYNGYLFGGVAVYNPWSVLCFLQSGDRVLRPYWTDTSSNDLLRELLLTGPRGARRELSTLLSGGTVDKPIEESIVLRDLSTRSDALWSFLLFTGYLKPVSVRYEQAEAQAVLAIPNAEVAGEIRKMVRTWFEAQLGDDDRLRMFLEALLRGDARAVERHLSHIAKVNASYFDTGGPEPERFYHGLVVGLLVGLGEAYEVRSNRESGYGRCDVLILPRAAGAPGVVLELKAVDTEEGETPEAAIVAALAQIRARDYAAELRERRAAPIHEMAAVFDGKRAYVRAG